MCGIVGYVGTKSAVELVYSGLSTLEYRGYDSAGISTLTTNGPQTIKEKGKLKQLAPLLSQLPDGKSAIGHTRWATHGEPSKRNAHPHSNRILSLVHNGIIENHESLKLSLIEKGYSFDSETDSEVVLKLLDHQLKFHSIKQAIVNVVGQLRGAYALGIICSRDPDATYVVREGSPIAIGLSSHGTFFASGVSAFIEHTSEAIFLQDKRIGRLTKNSIDLWNFEGKPETYQVSTIDWAAENIDKKDYEHFMLKEIYEQPTVVANNLANAESLISSLSEDIDLENINNIIIIGCGTAFHAGMVGKYLLEDHLVNVELASELKQNNKIIHNNNTLVIAMSQSGETADTLACVRRVKQEGGKVIAICNTRHSTLTREVDHTIYMDAGPEIGVAATKSFVSQIICLYLIKLALSSEDVKEGIGELHDLPRQMYLVLKYSDQIKEIASQYSHHSSHLFIGRGVNYPIALEGALKLKEISYIHAEGYAAGELKHGPIALIDDQMPIVSIAPLDSHHEKTKSNIEECLARNGILIVIGNKKQGLPEVDAFIEYPQSSNLASQAILATIPIQLYAYYAALKRGTDIDQPRNLAKSVTVE